MTPDESRLAMQQLAMMAVGVAEARHVDAKAE